MFIRQQRREDNRGTSEALGRELHKWSEVDCALAWIGLKPLPDLIMGIQSWLTVSLFDHCSLPALALRRGRLPSLSLT